MGCYACCLRYVSLLEPAEISGLSEAVRDIAWNAQLRLCHRYRRLIARGKNHNVVVTAIARELAGFIWAVARAFPIAV